ncbi:MULTISPECIES: O-antigen ligase family protein [Nocardioides]|uniref:O-antigen ligase family protein n=1 Tax=Nocardioides vastitatis TaxID=2568655 RepID=A0ABW0ZGX0_9ACTN|nr:O-antigen ligase family protein [Nocardioides sp.]THI98869.1 hypothetical protein E7Z54_13120 [Nocardioides sp.]
MSHPRELAFKGSAVAVTVPGLVLVAGALSVLDPLPVLVAAGAVVAVGAMVLRLDWAVLCYVAVEPFGDLLGSIHPSAVKGVGALLIVAWLLRLALEPRPVALRHPGVYATAALVLVVLASLAASGGNAGAGLGVAIRYLSYAAVLLVLVDTVRASGADGARLVRRAIAVFVVSCAAAGIVGLVGFVVNGGRAGGPLEDPNDFAFFLITALPFTLWLARTPGLAGRLYGLCGVVLVVATVATFSRGAMLGIGVMVVVALALGLLRPRTLLVGGVVIVLAVAIGWAAYPDVVDRSLDEKEHVAAANVDSRFTTWTMAAEMTAERPFLGQGPAGFQTEGPRFVPPTAVEVVQPDVAHQMYLDVAAELGLLGLGTFLAVIGYGVLGAVHARRNPLVRPAADAVLVATAGALVAASFLSEQYYLPVWLLAGLGIGLDPHHFIRKAGR